MKPDNATPITLANLATNAITREDAIADALRLIRERDELASALRLTLALEIEPGMVSTGKPLLEAIKAARAALAKIEGSA